MSQKSKSAKKGSSPPPSSKLPIVFGIVTILVLLVLGWVLVHGGLSEVPVPGKTALRTFLSGEAGEKMTEEDLKAIIERYEKQIREMKEAHRSEMQALREQHEQQLDEIKLELKLLQDENERLRESKE